jgi:hypothetical protein
MKKILFGLAAGLGILLFVKAKKKEEKVEKELTASQKKSRQITFLKTKEE